MVWFNASDIKPPPRPGSKLTSDYIAGLEKRIQDLEKRLFLLEPAGEDLDKHPALRKAWEEYKIIEKLTIGTDNE
jgi:hypothetical protein